MLLVQHKGKGSNELFLWRGNLPLMLQYQYMHLDVAEPAVSMEILATMGRLASIVRMKGVMPVDRINEDIENAFRPRTVFRRGPS
jgi:hypothetical protein